MNCNCLGGNNVELLEKIPVDRNIYICFQNTTPPQKNWWDGGSLSNFALNMRMVIMMSMILSKCE